MGDYIADPSLVYFFKALETNSWEIRPDISTTFRHGTVDADINSMKVDHLKSLENISPRRRSKTLSHNRPSTMLIVDMEFSLWRLTESTLVLEALEFTNHFLHQLNSFICFNSGGTNGGSPSWNFLKKFLKSL